MAVHVAPGLIVHACRVISSSARTAAWPEKLPPRHQRGALSCGRGIHATRASTVPRQARRDEGASMDEHEHEQEQQPRGALLLILIYLLIIVIFWLNTYLRIWRS